MFLQIGPVEPDSTPVTKRHDPVTDCVLQLTPEHEGKSFASDVLFFWL